MKPAARWAVASALVLCAAVPQRAWSQNPASESPPEVPLEGAEPAVVAAIESRRQALASADPALPAEARGRLWGELGMAYHAHELLQAAEPCYQNAQRLASAEARWHHLLGILRIEQGRFDEAASSFALALERAPTDPVILLRLGEARAKGGDARGSREAFRRALELDPGRAAAHCGLGAAAMALGDDREAAGELERCLELEPSATRFHAALASLYRRLGQPERASEHAGRFGSGDVVVPDRWLGEMRSLVARGDARLERAAEAARAGRIDAGVAEYRRAIEATPTDPRPHQALGNLYDRAGDLEAAIEHYRRAVELDPRSALSHFNLASLLARSGEDAEAILHFEAALRSDPGDLDARRALALLEQRRGADDRVVELLSGVLEVEPADGAARVGRAAALYRLGRRQEAVADFERAVAATPNDPGLRARLGALLLDLGDLERAERELRAAAELGPAGALAAEIDLRLGSIEASRGREAAARAHYEAALRANPDLLAARLELAALLARAGEHTEAATHYRTSLARDEGLVQARGGAAAALVLAGDCAGARDVVRSGLDRHPDDAALALVLVRVLATCPTAAPEDAAAAVRIARALAEKLPSATHAEALALALAASGAFEEAARIQRQLLEQGGDQADVHRLGAALERSLDRSAPVWPWAEHWAPNAPD